VGCVAPGCVPGVGAGWAVPGAYPGEPGAGGMDVGGATGTGGAPGGFIGVPAGGGTAGGDWVSTAGVSAAPGAIDSERVVRSIATLMGVSGWVSTACMRKR
jgi:hypothetical protein